jgi:hypothetical protein
MCPCVKVFNDYHGRVIDVAEELTMTSQRHVQFRRSKGKKIVRRSPTIERNLLEELHTIRTILETLEVNLGQKKRNEVDSDSDGTIP